jgi:hypothetical protein
MALPAFGAKSGEIHFVGKFCFALILPKFSHAVNNKFAIMENIFSYIVSELIGWRR